MLYVGLDAKGLADAQNAFFVDANAMIVQQIVPQPAVALIRTLLVDILDQLRKIHILGGSGTQLAGRPLVIGSAGNVQYFAGHFNGIALIPVGFPDRFVDMALPYFCEASPLAISSNFFSR